jgi:hypothetical protein
MPKSDSTILPDISSDRGEIETTSDVVKKPGNENIC